MRMANGNTEQGKSQRSEGGAAGQTNGVNRGAQADSGGWQRFSGSSGSSSRPTLDMISRSSTNVPIAVPATSYGESRGSASPTYRAAPSARLSQFSLGGSSYRSAPSPRSSGSSSYGGIWRRLLRGCIARGYSGGGSSRGRVSRALLPAVRTVAGTAKNWKQSRVAQPSGIGRLRPFGLTAGDDSTVTRGDDASAAAIRYTAGCLDARVSIHPHRSFDAGLLRNHGGPGPDLRIFCSARRSAPSGIDR